MPMFEYTCVSCGKRFEFLHVPGREEAAVCPHCGSADLRKQMAAFKASSGHRQGSEGQGTCCGMTDPCNDPKRCCGS